MADDANPEAPTSGWVFSPDISEEQMAQIQGLLAVNGVGCSASPGPDAAAAALANPNATIIRGPAGGGGSHAGTEAPSGGWIFSPDLTDEQRADVEGLIAANGLSTSADRAAEADAAFERMRAAHPDATVIGSSGVTSAGADDTTAAAQEAAFQKMVAEHPSAKEIAPGVYVCE